MLEKSKTDKIKDNAAITYSIFTENDLIGFLQHEDKSPDSAFVWEQTQKIKFSETNQMRQQCAYSEITHSSF